MASFAAQLEESRRAVRRAVERGINYSLLWREAAIAVLPAARPQNMGVIVLPGRTS